MEIMAVLKLKLCNNGFVFYKHAAFYFTKCLLMDREWIVWIACGLLWCFYQLFEVSFWWHPFTTEHPLLGDLFCEETNSSTSCMAWGEAYSFNRHNPKKHSL